MKKLLAVMKREYMVAVRRRSFIIMTFLIPVFLIALTIIPGYLMSRGMGQKRIAVLDGTGRLQEAFARPNETEKPDDVKKEAENALRGRRRELPSTITVEYANKSNVDIDKTLQPYLTRLTRDDDAKDKLEGIFIIPADAPTSENAKLSYYSRSATDFITQERLSRLANTALQKLRFGATGIRPEVVDDLLRDVPVEPVQISRSGTKKTGGELNFIVAFIFAALLVMPSLVYGQETMRGIVQEKSDRVVEVLISSVTPMQLLTGKILGVAAVGLTQISVWLVMIAIGGAYGAATMALAGANVTQFIRPLVFVWFGIFFILAYLTYVCIYAIAGSVCNNEREAQQFIMPVMFIMLVPWLLMMPIVMNPDAPFAVAFSMSPVFAPITMFVRTLVTEPPFWHIAVSIAVSVATIAFFFWITAKIFRVGILSYGKRPTLPELWRWIKVA
jgi:ABC-2 type transport system permease protein